MDAEYTLQKEMCIAAYFERVGSRAKDGIKLKEPLKKGAPSG